MRDGLRALDGVHREGRSMRSTRVFSGWGETHGSGLFLPAGRVTALVSSRGHTG